MVIIKKSKDKAAISEIMQQEVIQEFKSKGISSKTDWDGVYKHDVTTFKDNEKVGEIYACGGVIFIESNTPQFSNILEQIEKRFAIEYKDIDVEILIKEKWHKKSSIYMPFRCNCNC